MKFNKRGIIIIIALIVLAIVGFGGYGAYSYYYTEGQFTSAPYDYESGEPMNIVFNKVFNPRIATEETGANGQLMGQNFYMALTCGSIDANGYATCTGEVDVINNGSDPLDVEVTGAYYNVSDVSASGDIDADDFNWTSVTIPAGQRRTLTLTLNALVLCYEELHSETEDYYFDEPYNREVNAHFTVTASNHIE